MNNADQPAYPVSYHPENTTDIGLTKREYFAAMAMQGLLANPFYAERNHDQDLKTLANATGIEDITIDNRLAGRSIQVADQLLKQLQS